MAQARKSTKTTESTTKTTAKGKAKSTRKRKKTSQFKRLLIILLLLVAVGVILFLLTPSEEPATTPTAPATPSSGQIIKNLELPEDTGLGQIVTHTGYTLCYSEDDEQPYWVAYTLTRDKINGDIARKDNFRPDPAITTGSASLADYRSSGYDRGHLIPAADLCYSTDAMNDSFFLSNMSPQDPQFNRNIWADLEATVRNFANDNGTLYVVTGPVLTDGPYKTIGTNKVSVPNYYYKAILDYTDPELKGIAFILPNEDSENSLQSFAVSIDEVESITGFDFFPLLEDSQEATLEASFNVNLWNFDEFYRSSSTTSTYTPAAESPAEPASTDSDWKSILYNALYSIFGELKKTLLSTLKKAI